MRRSATSPRPSLSPRLLIVAAAGLAVVAIGWRLAEPAAAKAPSADVAPVDYVPEDSPESLRAPVDPLGPLDASEAPAAPLDFVRVTSGFGLRRHPILGFTRMHQGVDLAAREGAPVFAAADGVVTESRWDGGYGQMLRIRHAGGWATGYAHLSAFAPGVASGVAVAKGEVVGFVGHTGEATGPHLHYEVVLNGVKLDPMKTPFGGATADDPHAGAYASAFAAVTAEPLRGPLPTDSPRG
jgi:murein DD-endopeptidase MepM/ murein hydrolase activator NlpD